MSYFIIRHRSTGRFMPALPRGATWWEPTKSKEASPRLFAKRAHASNAKDWWERGAWLTEYNRSSSWDGDDDAAFLARREPEAPRKKGDLEILEVELKIIGQMELAI